MIDRPPPPLHPAQLPPQVLLDQCDRTHGRRSGPGGQHRNKVATAVHLLHRPTGAQAQASERRSQAENLKVALFRLRVNLALQYRGQADQPTDLWQQRARGGTIACNNRHDDYPALLAEALDHTMRHRGDAASAACVMGVSPTQLIRFLATEPRALEQVNTLRTRRALHPLKA